MEDVASKWYKMILFFALLANGYVFELNRQINELDKTLFKL